MATTAASTDRFVDPLAAKRTPSLWRDTLGNILRLVIDDAIRSADARQPCAFLLPAGDGDHTAAMDYAKLHDHRTDRAGGCRHHQGLSRLWLANMQ